jgi:hypothetical protein
VIEFGKEGIFVKTNDLRDFSWDVISYNDKISSFSKGIVEKTIPVVIICTSEEEGLKKKNKLFEVMEKDVLTGQHGRLVLGDYYLKCFITSSSKSNYFYHKGYIEISLKLTTDFPSWVKETKTVFNSSSSKMSEFLDHPYDFDYDYATEFDNVIVKNTGFVPANFRMVIYGYANHPKVFIAGHEYSVDVDIDTGEYLTIDSLQKTIILTKNNGKKENCFNKRNKASYIFEKIGVGSSLVTCEGELLVDIILVEERSEPKWT